MGLWRMGVLIALFIPPKPPLLREVTVLIQSSFAVGHRLHALIYIERVQLALFRLVSKFSQQLHRMLFFCVNMNK
jgi:hypothetical protein